MDLDHVQMLSQHYEYLFVQVYQQVVISLYLHLPFQLLRLYLFCLLNHFIHLFYSVKAVDLIFIAGLPDSTSLTLILVCFCSGQGPHVGLMESLSRLFNYHLVFLSFSFFAFLFLIQNIQMKLLMTNKYQNRPDFTAPGSYQQNQPSYKKHSIEFPDFDNMRNCDKAFTQFNQTCIQKQQSNNPNNIIIIKSTQQQQMARRPSYSDSDEQQNVEQLAIKSKPVIKLKEWLHNFKPNNPQHLKQHIMSFFIAEGLYDVAKTFSQQAGVTLPPVDQVKIKERYQIKNYIRRGMIAEALEKIRSVDPGFQTDEKNSQLVFSMKCLKVINLIKQGNLEGSIEAARVELLPFTKKGQKYVKQTQKVMGLLAFMNLKDCPNKQLVKEEHSSKVASRINRHLLNSREEGNQQALEALLKLGKWCENRLSQFISFPKINLQSQSDIFKQPS